MLMRIALAKIRVEILERLAFRWNFVFEVVGTISMLLVFLLVDRFQTVVFGDKLAAATGKLGTSYFGYVALGLAISSLSSASLGGVLGHFYEEKRHQTFPLILTSPISIWRWALSAGAASLVHACTQFLMIFGVSIAALGLRVPDFSWASAFLVMAISLPSLWALSVLCLSTALLFRRGDPLGFLLGISLEILGGVYLPLEMLPKPVQALARLIPLSSSVEAMQKVVYAGASLSQVFPQVRDLIVLGLIYVPVSYFAIRAADRRARRLGLYFLS